MGSLKEKGQSNLKYIKLGMIERDTENERLAIYNQKKGEDGKYVFDKEFRELSGELVGCAPSTYNTEQSGDVHGFRLFIDLHDSENPQLVSLEGNLSYASRGFLNSLFNITNYTEEFKMWTSKYNNHWGIHVKHVDSGEKKTLSWKYQPSEMPDIPKVQFKGREVGDDTNINLWFHERLEELNKTLKGHPDMPSFSSEAPAAAPSTSSNTGDSNQKYLDNVRAKFGKAESPEKLEEDYQALVHHMKNGEPQHRKGEATQLAVNAIYLEFKNKFDTAAVADDDLPI